MPPADRAETPWSKHLCMSGGGALWPSLSEESLSSHYLSSCKPALELEPAADAAIARTMTKVKVHSYAINMRKRKIRRVEIRPITIFEIKKITRINSETMAALHPTMCFPNKGGHFSGSQHVFLRHSQREKTHDVQDIFKKLQEKHNTSEQLHSVSHQLSTITNCRPLLQTTIIWKFLKLYGSFCVCVMCTSAILVRA